MSKKEKKSVPGRAATKIGRASGRPKGRNAAGGKKRRTVADSLFRVFFSMNPIPTVITSIEDGRIVGANPAFVRLSGYTEKEIISSSTLDLNIWDDHADRDRVVAMLRESGSIAGMETRLRSRSNGVRHCLFSADLIDMNGGRYILATAVDMTERLRTEGLLARELAVNRELASLSEKILEKALTFDQLADMIIRSARLLSGSDDIIVMAREAGEGRLTPLGRPGGVIRTHLARCEADGAGRLTFFSEGGDGASPGLSIPAGEVWVDNGGGGDGIPPAGGVARILIAPAAVGGEVLGLVVAANAPRDYTEDDRASMKMLADLYAIAINRVRSEERIRVSLREKELLLKEIHHRVKNNMQIISSLMGLQSAHVKDPRDEELFIESQNRVRSMAMVHEKLYQSDNLAALDFREYVDDLVREISHTCRHASDRVTLRVEVESVPMDVDHAIPCALIVYELVSNALKHAFPGERRGEIAVEFGRDDGGCILRVRDNGVGMNPVTDLGASRSLGLQLVAALIRQLRGAAAVESSGAGTVFTVRFGGCP